MSDPGDGDSLPWPATSGSGHTEYLLQQLGTTWEKSIWPLSGALASDGNPLVPSTTPQSSIPTLDGSHNEGMILFSNSTHAPNHGYDLYFDLNYPNANGMQQFDPIFVFELTNILDF
jgi:hypothetical protein